MFFLAFFSFVYAKINSFDTSSDDDKGKSNVFVSVSIKMKLTCIETGQIILNYKTPIYYWRSLIRCNAYLKIHKLENAFPTLGRIKRDLTLIIGAIDDISLMPVSYKGWLTGKQPRKQSWTR